jgi:ABC-type glycerol-3-phosphate transport system permease component
VYLLLLSGTALFLFPFVWMVLTSLKTDEEIQQGGWWPQVPVMRASSPYARPAAEPRRPGYVEEARWSAALPGLRRVAGAAVDEALARSAVLRDDAALREAAVSVVVEQVAPRLAKSDWDGGPDAVATAFEKWVTGQVAADALDARMAAVALLGLQVRTLDASIHNVFSGGEIAARWTIETPARAQLLVHRDTSLLRYDFAGSLDPIVLRADFEFPAEADELHKLILTLRPDNSWHRLDAALEIGGRRWTSRRPTHLAQHRVTSVIFQPPGFDDTTLQARTWVPLREEEGARVTTAGSSSRRSTLRLTLTPSTTWSASWAKALRNYARAFHAVPFWRYTLNSLLLVALTTLGTLFASTFVAYAFARLRWPGRGVALVILLATMMLPAQVTMVPSFLIWRELGWYNTLNPLWVPAFGGGAFFIFMMTQHMKTLPRELEESARIDGLGAVQTWYYIILPQVKPAAAAVAIMTFMWSWNEFLGPLVYLRDQAKFPLSLGLFALRLENFGDWSLIMAANVLMTLPVIVIFFLCQRYFIEGMTMSGLKG